MGKGLTRK